MKIGVPKERKSQEGRVGLLPSHAAYLCKQGHTVVVEEGAGKAIGFSDEQYRIEGAKVISSLEEVYDSELIVKVKEPVEEEIALLRSGQILFCYLHLAASKNLTEKLIASGVSAIAYESVTDSAGGLPLLRPMSEIAGRISIQAGAWGLQYSSGGKGILLGGSPGVLPGRVLIIGGGTAGTEAIRMAVGMGAAVTVVDSNISQLRLLQNLFGSRIQTLTANHHELEKQLMCADLIVGAVLLQGKRAPKLLTKEMLRIPEKGTAFVDIAIDQGGIAETSRPTTHDNPFYIEEGIVHYCVTNMPGACPKTSTYALTNVTFPFVLELATLGISKALIRNPFLMKGLNVFCNSLTYEPVAQDHNLHFTPPETILS